MDEISLRNALAMTPVKEFRYFPETGSTNDVALEWAQAGGPDGALVVADAQIAGRGRMGRTWFTPPGSALAFSLLLRPTPSEVEHIALFAPLGALAIASVFEQRYGMPVLIKWPNDILLECCRPNPAGLRKAAGILVETVWQDNLPLAVVVGVGINVAPEAVPPDDQVIFPATSVEQARFSGDTRPLKIKREELLAVLLNEMFTWREQLGSPEFFIAWERRLAFRGELVSIEQPGKPALTGRLLGLDPDGSLRLLVKDEPIGAQEQNILSIKAGDVTLRPAL